MKMTTFSAIVYFCGFGLLATGMVAIIGQWLDNRDALRKSYPEGHNVVIGEGAALDLTIRNRCIVLGRHASAPTKDGQLIIRFTDGTEFVRDLPPGKIVDVGDVSNWIGASLMNDWLTTHEMRRYVSIGGVEQWVEHWGNGWQIETGNGNTIIGQIHLIDFYRRVKSGELKLVPVPK